MIKIAVCDDDEKNLRDTLKLLEQYKKFPLSADAYTSGEALLAAGVLKKEGDALKILANGELTKKLTVKAQAFSEAAKAKIEAAGGKAEVV